jgi:pyridinium-3,5-biscarboxylic acid mononucleotide sulfurtransferase
MKDSGMIDSTNSEVLDSRLSEWFSGITRAAIALSGGIDSSLVAFAARRFLKKENVVAVISASASLKRKELDEAREFCQLYDIHLKEIDSNEIEDKNYRENPINRCFYCKSALYNEMEKLIEREFKDFTVLNGNNYSDFGDFRPGLKAANDHKIMSPLAECKFTKEDIREVARWYGLPNWNKPASPCLSSRIPYGEGITIEKLRQVEQAENLLNRFGFDDVRVRLIKNVARIEVPGNRVPELKMVIDRIKPEFESYGFEGTLIDEEGLVSGKLNRNIVKSEQ